MMILIADDFESEINLLQEVLSELGYTNILIAYDGAEAIKLLGAHKVDIVITDYNMPFKTGGDVVKVALQKGIDRILLRSSHSVDTLRQKTVGLSGFEIICKRDYDKQGLKQLIKELISEH
jgi:CheY-like chemotaxis protein